MRHFSVERTIEVPENIDAKLITTRDGKEISIKGPKGELRRIFSRLRVHISLDENKFIIQNHFGNKAEASMVGTITGHIKNMIKGVTEGFTYKVQVITSHFPATVEVQKKEMLIKNLYGRRDPIRVPYEPTVEISVTGDMITLKGIDIEKVSQTATSLAESTRLRGKRSKDPTVFQDGLYIVYP